MTYSPTVRRRRLSLALLQFRRDAGLRAEEAARRLGWQASKITRIERNEWRRPNLSDVLDLLDAYEVTDESTRQAIITLTREARKRGWWEETQYRDILGAALIGLEWEASEIRTFETVLVPGLFQTRDYAAAVFRAGRVMDEQEVQRQVEARLTRQQLLDRDDPPAFWVIIDEAALRKHVGGPEVMRGQLRHLRALAERPNIGLQVLPDTAGAHMSMNGPFTILDYRDDRDLSIVYVEVGRPGDLFLEAPEDVGHYRRKYEYLQGSALSVEESAAYLDKLMNLLG
ncbi:helix-turn-helix transcriptional regulator [Thermopolyspora sp. NPDC052614]|uniref:helix-turn-helix domain-containing protein n=1 Tax=Thermopolyspora sp. NPDC052614 TaxID=3155682 RepID=UPI0034431BEE